MQQGLPGATKLPGSGDLRARSHLAAADEQANRQGDELLQPLARNGLRMGVLGVKSWSWFWRASYSNPRCPATGAIRALCEDMPKISI